MHHPRQNNQNDLGDPAIHETRMRRSLTLDYYSDSRQPRASALLEFGQVWLLLYIRTLARSLRTVNLITTSRSPLFSTL